MKFLSKLTMTALVILCFQAGGSLAMAQSIQDFSGNWVGSCVVNGKISPSQKTILQHEDQAIEINGMKFDLNKPTVTTIDDVDQGDKYREITVYDWQWDVGKTSIQTSARWLGWYLDKPGSWQGNGVGIIKLEGKSLIMTRKFGDIDEKCTLQKN